MTTKNSPLRQLKRQANEIAANLKRMERGEAIGETALAARQRDHIKFGVVMDDKTLAIEMSWATIKSYSEAGLAEFILKHMRESRERVH